VRTLPDRLDLVGCLAAKSLDQGGLGHGLTP
jgi:hypothetical protein